MADRRNISGEHSSAPRAHVGSGRVSAFPDALAVRGRVHSVETFGTVDGPGTRLVVFCQGCPLRCAYCHNPDTWEIVPTDAPEKGGVVARAAGDAVLDNAWAAGDAAPDAAVSARPDCARPGHAMSVGEVLEAFDRNREFYRRGGITVTGGEPLVQPEFVAALFSAAHADPKGRIHTCLDTSGATFDPNRSERVAAVLDECDLVLLDIKHADPEGHRRLTGHGQERVLAFGDELARRGIKVLVRHVSVPGVTDTPEELAGVGRIIARWPNVVGLDVLPYHTMGKEKYERLGIPYPLEGVSAMPPARVPELRRAIMAARADERRRLGLV